ncbi:MAG: penicillin-binding protein 1B [Desulforhopalus sp.]
MKIKLIWTIAIFVVIGCLITGVPYIYQLDKRITSRFEGRRWELPARIFARPLELYVGRSLSRNQLVAELDQLHYSQEDFPEKPGSYSREKHQFTIYSRKFAFSDGDRPSKRLTLEIDDNTITSLYDQTNGTSLSYHRLEPVQYAAIYPAHNEDRVLVRLTDVPELLINTLLLVEDESFFTHWGVRPGAILRAALANLKAGKTVQGGSTLTQQLVKNIFLTSEQSLLRKANEAIMALLLEYHYSKEEILEGYLNEIYLGQDGIRAIHGFAMASRFYFGRDLDELKPEQLALLVGIVKGASYYNPRKHPERATLRRNQVLEILTGSNQAEDLDIARLKTIPLGVTSEIPSGITPYPSFLQLVRRQLLRDYSEEDLRSEGLSIFTTLDPIIQRQAERNLAKRLTAIELRRGEKAKDTLQGSLVIASADQGEVIALVGDRSPRRAGFNRALDMQRPIGSIVKPAVYLAALSQPGFYNLLTTVYDEPLEIAVDGQKWQPENYDKTFHGPLPLMEALVNSYNAATVQLGMEVGLDTVIKTLRQLGVEKPIEPYPSLLLGSVEMPPFEVLQMYQTISAGGYRTPLRAILAVTDQQHKTLQRYPLTVQQGPDPKAVFCLTAALQRVTSTGTARSLQQTLPPGMIVAGKTGTTDQLRDSWFAGFSGNHVAVAWVGRDDNRPTGLTGATGALGVWAATMAEIATNPLHPEPPPGVNYYYSDIQSGRIFSARCGGPRPPLLPFIAGGLLPDVIACNKRPPMKSLEETIQKGVESILDFLQ